MFDEDRSALVIGEFLTETPTLGDRPFLAHRRPAWLALDDKTVIDGFWDRAGIARAPSAVVGTGAVDDVWDEIDRGDGVVVAVDATHGWTGGAEGTRPVRRRAALGDVLADWAGRRVRVTPFLEGVPCSVHGIVFADEVVAFRPVELIVLRRGEEFFYAGCSSIWDPPEAARAQMRATACRAGEQLRAEVDYRGAFTVDGVLTAEGFLPTELNPRNGAGLATMSRGMDFPLQLLLDALVGGVELEWRPRELEAGLLAHFDAHRAGGTWKMLPVARRGARAGPRRRPRRRRARRRRLLHPHADGAPGRHVPRPARGRVLALGRHRARARHRAVGCRRAALPVGSPAWLMRRRRGCSTAVSGAAGCRCPCCRSAAG